MYELNSFAVQIEAFGLLLELLRSRVHGPGQHTGIMKACVPDSSRHPGVGMPR